MWFKKNLVIRRGNRSYDPHAHNRPNDGDEQVHSARGNKACQSRTSGLVNKYHLWREITTVRNISTATGIHPIAPFTKHSLGPSIQLLYCKVINIGRVLKIITTISAKHKFSSKIMDTRSVFIALYLDDAYITIVLPLTPNKSIIVVRIVRSSLTGGHVPGSRLTGGVSPIILSMFWLYSIEV